MYTNNNTNIDNLLYHTGVKDCIFYNGSTGMTSVYDKSRVVLWIKSCRRAKSKKDYIVNTLV